MLKIDFMKISFTSFFTIFTQLFVISFYSRLKKHLKVEINYVFKIPKQWIKFLFCEVVGRNFWTKSIIQTSGYVKTRKGNKTYTNSDVLRFTLNFIRRIQIITIVTRFLVYLSGDSVQSTNVCNYIFPFLSFIIKNVV